jgi:hypothetical protein
LRHYATSRKVAESSPDEVDFLNVHNPSSRTMILGCIQSLTEISTRNFLWGKVWPTLNLSLRCAEAVTYRILKAYCTSPR